MQEFATIKSLLSLLSRMERIRILALAPLLAVSSLAEMFGVGAIIFYLGTLNSIVSRGTADLPLAVGTVGFTPQTFSIFGGAALITVFLFKALLIIGIQFMLMQFVFNAFERFSIELFKSYLKAPLVFHLTASSAVIQRNVNLQSTIVFNSVGVSISYLASNSLAILVLCIALAWLQPTAFILAAGILILVSGLSYALLRRHLARLGRQRVTYSGKALTWVAHSIGLIREIKISGREAQFHQLFGEQIRGLALADRSLRVASQLPSLTNECTLVIGVVGIVLLYVLNGRSLPEVLPILAAFGVAGVRIMGMLASVVGHLHQLQFYGPAVLSVRAASAELDKCTQTTKPPQIVDNLPIRLRSDLSFERVSFRYPGTAHLALSDISVPIPKGKHIAVVGASGSGKSTLALLAVGLLEPLVGSILVDGIPISADRSAWFRKIAYVPQSVYLVDDTIRANVAFEFERVGQHEHEDAAIWEVLEITQLEETVRRLPFGLDTTLYENGSGFSTGERQRLGIARALYRRPELLVLDEATSALDGYTETRLFSALVQNCPGSTIITVAHRVSLAKISDLVLWLDRGKLLGIGHYKELLLRSTEFRSIFAE